MNLILSDGLIIKADTSKMDKPLTASTFNKVLAFGLAMTLVVWTFGVYFALPAKAVEQHPEGTLVVSGSTVYKIMGGQRIGFPSANVFLSHGYSWSQVVPANSADLALPQGANATYADGTLVNDGGTIFIISGGQKRGFTSGSVFTGLGYSFANVVNDSLAGYTQGANVDSATMAHPAGTLVNASGTIWHMMGSERHGIPTMAVFQSHGFSLSKAVPANAADLAVAAGANKGYRVGAIVNDGGTVYAITSATEKRGFPSASCYTDFGFTWAMAIAGSTAGYTAGANFCGSSSTTSSTATTVNSTGNLSVSLASDTPASGVAIKNAARVPFTKVMLTATGGDVVIDSWTVARVGVGQDSDFSSVDVIDLSNGAAINETGKSFNSDHQASFSEDMTIKSGETKYVMLAGNMASSLGAGNLPALALQAITLKGGTVSGSFPITGNAMQVNNSITIGSATVQRGAYTNATSTVEVGKKDYTFFSFQVQAGSTEDITFNNVKVYQAGSASLSSDLSNIKLYRDGTFLASGTVSNNYVSFQVPNETILKGQTAQYVVKADVVSGSQRTVILSIYRTTDLYVVGKTYNAGITPTMSGTGSSAGSPVLADNTFTIGAGSLRISRSSATATGNITVGSNQELSAFEFEVKGEPVVVTALTLTTATSTGGGDTADALNSLRIVDSTGKTVAGPVDRANGGASAAFTDTFTVPVGTNVYKVFGNLSTSGGWASDDTVTVSISAVTSRGDQTQQTITATGLTATGVTQTLKVASLTVTKNSTPTNRTVIKNSVGVLVGSWQFDATNSGEDVRITSLGIRASSTGKLTNLTLKDGTKSLSPVNSAISSSSANATTTFALSEPIVVKKGESKTIDMYADIPSTANAGEVDAFGITTSAGVTAYGVTTGNSASVTVVANNGALLTIAAAGTLTVEQDSSTPAARLVVHGTTGVSLAEVRMKATNEDVDVTKLTVGIVDGALTGTAAGTYAQVSKFMFKKDGVIVGNASGYVPGQQNTVVNLGSGVLTIPEGTTGIKLSIVGDIVSIGTNLPGTANADIKVGLGPIETGTAGAASTFAFNAVGKGSNTTATMSYSASTGTAMILHKAVPSVVIETPANKLGASAVLSRVKVSAVGNTIGLFRLAFVTTTSTGVNITNGYARLASCGACGGVSDGTVLSGTVALGTEIATGTKTWNFEVDDNSGVHGKNFLEIAAGGTAVIDFYATVGLTTNSDTVTTSLLGDTASSTNNSTGGNAAAAFTVSNQGNFVWSDLNGTTSQSTGRAEKQWYNGYLVSGLGSTTTSTPVSVGE